MALQQDARDRAGADVFVHVPDERRAGMRRAGAQHVKLEAVRVDEIGLPLGKDRAEAIARMSRALEMFIVEGIHTTIPLHRRIMQNADFQAAQFDTKFMERFLEQNGAEASKSKASG